ncbi:Transposon Tf2-9 polyprotein [Thelohanellus kitauei]|uniref:Transposon Tf2-9 polyprotein n=1 Tax=Thelohanellus kitauei TaxID=669202 RepID=A0A0C2JAB1_THEKT|nr:Transposon Tf2-9 polyprotein [Thelohanellus kitauei]
MLSHYDQNLPLVLETDASNQGIGSVLYHKYPNNDLRPIGFASRTLSKSEKGYSTIEKEALSIVFGVKKFNQFLYGRKFVLKTDHKPLERIFSNNHPLPIIAISRLERWAVIVSRYDFEVEYKPGRTNQVADSLSRLPSPLTEPTEDEKSDQATDECIKKMHTEEILLSKKLLKRETASDPTSISVVNFLNRGWPVKSVVPKNLLPYYELRENISLEEEIIMFGHRIIIPQILRTSVLSKLHMGHPGCVPMKDLAKTYVWWPNISQDIELYVKSCEPCQRHRPQDPETPLYSWDVPEGPWVRLHVDFAGPYDGSYWFVVVDAFSKWMEINRGNNPSSTVVKSLLRQHFSRFVVPHSLVSDNGPCFVSNEMKVFCTEYQIKHIRTTPYHSRSNGAVERLIRTFKGKYAAERRMCENK